MERFHEATGDAYSDLRGDELMEEALSRAIGKQGQQVWMQANPGLRARITRWIADAWRTLRRQFGVDRLDNATTVEEFAYRLNEDLRDRSEKGEFTSGEARFRGGEGEVGFSRTRPGKQSRNPDETEAGEIERWISDPVSESEWQLFLKLIAVEKKLADKHGEQLWIEVNPADKFGSGYYERWNAIVLKRRREEITKGLVAEELQHAIDTLSGLRFRKGKGVAALKRKFGFRVVDGKKRWNILTRRTISRRT